LNGIIIIDKPAGWTSFDVIAKLRGAIKRKHDVKKNHRVGHGGTLDPLATGVLPVFIGRATRAAEFCENAQKEYIAGLRPGIVTDTQDITGSVLSENNVAVTYEDVKAILPHFLGAGKQIPPMYSAIKKDGKKLYELARQGIDVTRQPRDIFISSIELLSKTGTDPAFPFDFTLRVVCSKGTYIRTLCHDIGSMLGCGAALSALRRTRAGVFTVDMAHALDDVLDAVMTGSLSSGGGDGRYGNAENDSITHGFLLPIDSIFSGFPSIKLNDSDTRKAKNGALRHITVKENGKYRFYAPDGEFLLFGEVHEGKVKTIKSFFEV